MIIEPSNVRKKNKGTTECNKGIIKCDVDIAQYDNGISNVKKK